LFTATTTVFSHEAPSTTTKKGRAAVGKCTTPTSGKEEAQVAKKT